jgi:hypothetical protein
MASHAEHTMDRHKNIELGRRQAIIARLRSGAMVFARLAVQYDKQSQSPKLPESESELNALRARACLANIGDAEKRIREIQRMPLSESIWNRGLKKK